MKIFIVFEYDPISGQVKLRKAFDNEYSAKKFCDELNWFRSYRSIELSKE